ncbi:MAG: hemolysin III family protein [Deltaproteobacteria bacterium]|nr:hemolysin III family protein [Deltaproteobacteria bacterium]MBW2360612.1 hemolysin III family protein [Deltaproteobacteria bacterium]
MGLAFRVRVFKDPVSSTLHFVAFWVAVIAALALLARVAHDGPKTAGMAIYCATLVLLFLSSSLYHWFDLGERGNRWLRRIDHAAIFLLIAGTAVPAIFHLLEGVWRVVLLSLMLGFGVAGALLKLVWIDCPRWLGLALYFGLSAVALTPAHLIGPQLSFGALAWLLGGVVAYSVGALVYARNWPDPWPGRFGHHEIWHLFVIAGAGAHYAFQHTLVDLPYAPL